MRERHGPERPRLRGGQGETKWVRVSWATWGWGSKETTTEARVGVTVLGDQGNQKNVLVPTSQGISAPAGGTSCGGNNLQQEAAAYEEQDPIVRSDGLHQDRDTWS